MGATITWIGVGIFALFIVIGLVMGLIRGIKRTSLHFAFMIMAFVLAFFITKPIANSLLEIKLPLDGGNYTLGEFIIKSLGFDITNFQAAGTFISKLPTAIVSPVLFIVLLLVCYGLFDIIYLIVARLTFGKKKDDFAESKPYRSYGAAIGVVEGLVFLVLLFAPITSLTNTFEAISYTQATTSAVSAEQAEQEEGSEKDNHLPTIPEILNDTMPKEIKEVVYAYNNSLIAKIAGAGGIDDILFDGMSKIEVNGQKIVLRKDIITGTKIYNDVARFYNDFVDQNYKGMRFGALKANIDKILDSGIFKGVLAETAEQFIKSYDTFDFTKDLPEMVKNILDDVKTSLETKEISFTEYLRNDLSKIADAGAKVFNSGIFEDYLDLEQKDFLSILKFIDEKVGRTLIDEVMTDLLETNIMEDCLPTLLEFASDKTAEIFDGIEVKLNTAVSDIKGTLTTVKEIIPDFIQVCEYFKLPDLMNAKDKLDFFAKELDEYNLTRGLDKAGVVLDKLRNLEILVVDGEHSLDQIFEHYDFNLLGGDVYEMVDGVGTKVTLDNYTAFFNHIKEPILIAKKNNLLSGLDSKVMTTLLLALKEDSKIIAKVVLPFKGMQAFDLESMVYDKVITTLKDVELSPDQKLFDFTYLEKQGLETDEKNFERWNEAFEILGQTLHDLDQGTVDGTMYSYIEYVLSSQFDQEKLINSLIDDDQFEQLISPIFNCELFKPLSEVFVEKIDSEIAEVTGITSGTTYESLKSDPTAASTLKQILNLIKGLDTANLNLETVGQILTVLQENANTGKGVFEKTFYNFIWYLTGDNLESFDVAGHEPIKEHTTIKGYLEKGASVGVGTKEFYKTVSFTDKFAQIEKAKEFGTKLADQLSGIEQFDLAHAADLKKALEESVKGFSSEEVVSALEDLGGFVDKASITQKIGSNQEIVKQAIGEVFKTDTNIRDAFLTFLELNN